MVRLAAPGREPAAFLEVLRQRRPIGARDAKMLVADVVVFYLGHVGAASAQKAVARGDAHLRLDVRLLEEDRAGGLGEGIDVGRVHVAVPVGRQLGAQVVDQDVEDVFNLGGGCRRRGRRRPVGAQVAVRLGRVEGRLAPGDAALREDEAEAGLGGVGGILVDPLPAAAAAGRRAGRAAGRGGGAGADGGAGGEARVGEEADEAGVGGDRAGAPAGRGGGGGGGGPGGHEEGRGGTKDSHRQVPRRGGGAAAAARGPGGHEEGREDSQSSDAGFLLAFLSFVHFWRTGSG